MKVLLDSNAYSLLMRGHGEVAGLHPAQFLETSLAVNAPKSEREYITRTVIEWLRQRLPGTS